MLFLKIIPVEIQQLIPYYFSFGPKKLWDEKSACHKSNIDKAMNFQMAINAHPRGEILGNRGQHREKEEENYYPS